ncbi:PREDICTED: serine/threonine-protein phosphatase BSL3-like [Erythranthe guttata]|nr:PREDICTED: serine/threonine-protein phosphatase BSL3-like [Erythranthe guttata]|eukprot:XP_012832634.1 PREDICTED: serine/threonine-protein phosphatase BSL3-like [Erythranthe guttata]
MDVDSATTADADHDPSEEPVAANGAVRLSESQSSLPLQQQQENSDMNNSDSVDGGGGGGGGVVAGPRCAPSYSVVNALMDKKEDGPGPRCGHTLTAVPAVGEEGNPGYIGPRLILFGGATALEGNSAASGTPTSAGSAGIRLAGATADVHCYDALTNKWTRVTPIGEPPTPRAAHVATAVGTMVVIQGGIGPAGLSAEDLHVLDLTQQRPRWHRVVVHGPGPGPRYGHVMALVGQRYLIAIGGNDGKRPLADVWALDTAAKPYEWRKLEPEGEGPPPCMYATASARSDGLLLLCGGRDANSVVMRYQTFFLMHIISLIHIHLTRLYIVCIARGTGMGRVVSGQGFNFLWAAAAAAASNLDQGRLQGRYGFTDDRTRASIPDPAADGAVVVGSPVAPPVNGDIYTDISTENAMLQGSRALSKGVEYLVEASAAEAEAITAALAAAKARRVNGEVELPDRDRGAEATSSGKQISTQIKPDSAAPNNSVPAGVRLHHRAVVVAAETGGALGGMVRQLSIDQFENEGRRVSYGTPESATAARKLLDRQMSIHSVAKKVIAHLLKPRGWKPPVRRQFFLDCNEIADLCDCAERIFASEPSVLQLKAPIKIFGDLHGQFGDLMRLFDEYGSPSTAGDIAYIDYLFLGDYVDRGQHSMETISLLLALKVEHPHQVHLIRGNHEAADINALFGFRIECIERMGERDGIWTWHRINRLFNWLPLAALIEKKIICMHGGIGRSINHVEQIENIQRPIAMEAGSIVLMDLLWSDPTENDSVEGLRPNARGPGLVTFGPDRVMEFCNNNDLQLIVRAHECVMDGFERFAQGHLITLFSATNYCGTANNAGAILVLGRDLVVVPKLIHPLPPAISSPETSPERLIEDTWMQELNANRPPTPTRGRPQVTNDRGSLAWI